MPRPAYQGNHYSSKVEENILPPLKEAIVQLHNLVSSSICGNRASEEIPINLCHYNALLISCYELNSVLTKRRCIVLKYTAHYVRSIFGVDMQYTPIFCIDWQCWNWGIFHGDRDGCYNGDILRSGCYLSENTTGTHYSSRIVSCTHMCNCLRCNIA